MATALPHAAARAQGATHWVTTWAASDQGAYPAGGTPLPRAFPDGHGAHDQTLRLIIKPDLWGYVARLRFSDAFGDAPVTIDGVFVGLQQEAAKLVPRSNRAVTFKGARAVTIAPGQTVWSDSVSLGFVGYTQAASIVGRRLAVSVHVVDAPALTWHGDARTTSYVGARDGGAHGNAEDEDAVPIATPATFLLDAVDMRAPADSMAVVALGDSITAGVGATLNGDDRWTDALSRRLHALYGDRIAVVNAGISGNRVLPAPGAAPGAASGPPPDGGPPAVERMERDVLGLSGVGAVIWLEGINDLADGVTPEALAEGLKQGTVRLRAGQKGLRLIGATLTPALGTDGPHGTEAVDRQRRALNQFIRLTDIFDAVVEFDPAVADPHTGALREDFAADPAAKGGDRLHLNHAGALALGAAVDPKALLPAPPPRPAPVPAPAVASDAGQ